jgi:hypothetical protein
MGKLGGLDETSARFFLHNDPDAGHTSRFSGASLIILGGLKMRRLLRTSRLQKPFLAIQLLEQRRMLCIDHATAAPGEFPEPFGTPVEVLPPGPRFPKAPHAGPETSAVIRWTNRGTPTNDSDRFNSVFGAGAEAARQVVDAALRHFERMVGSFNYASGPDEYNLSLSMSATGTSLGASASLNTTLGGKPKSGTVTMGRGGTGSSAWWIDPTPDDHSEFQGSILHAFTSDATPGGPADGRRDFYTVVCAEVTHCLGLYGGLGMVPSWDALTTNTGIPDNAEGGGVGNFWVFRGPSIKHLLTGNNGGPSGNAFPGGVHSAGPTENGIFFDGLQYIGAHDIGNARYEASRRYFPNLNFALMFKDAFDYSTVNPAQFGTTYSNLNTSTGQLLVRGSTDSLGSNDQISISLSGTTLTVSVDIGIDSPGTGALPGPGDLPPWVSQYDASHVSAIVVRGGDGNDNITINHFSPGVSVLVDGQGGSDTVSVQGGPNPVSVITDALDTVLVNTDGIGTASVLLESPLQSLNALHVGVGGLVRFAPGAGGVLNVKSLAISGGRLDLSDNDLIVDYAGASPLVSVTSLLSTGFNSGSWDGPGISTSAATAITGLGILESSAYAAATGMSTFSGQPIDSTMLLIKFTYNGDSDLNGLVDFDDYARIDAGFLAGGTGTWFSGDSDYSSVIDFDDFARIDAAFLLQGPVL